MEGRIQELESQILKVQGEKEDVQKRFEEHMQTNAMTEKSLHERIFDL